jgi:hypothetical protein
MRLTIFLVVALAAGLPVEAAAADGIARWVATSATTIWRPGGEDWCGEGVHVDVSSAYEGFFSGPSAEHERDKALSGLKLAIEYDCPSAEVVRVSGFVKGRYSVEGCLRRKTEWHLFKVKEINSGTEFIDPFNYSDNRECRLPNGTREFSAEYLAIKDSLAALSGPHCESYMSHMMSVEAESAREGCRIWKQAHSLNR